MAGAFAVLAVYDAIKMSRERAMSAYVMAPYVLEDEGGSFTLSSAEGLFSGTYEKHYIEGSSAGTVVPIKKTEFYELKGEAEALWGRTDWKGDWVPGKLRKELPVVEPDGGS
jgi:hypothetical protein